MSHAVLRGHPTRSQLYLDTILDSIGEEYRCSKDTKAMDHVVNLADIIYYCMKQKLYETFMINGSSGEIVTYGEILTYSIALAQTIREHAASGKILIVLRNHKHMAKLYYATLFADVIPLMIDPNSTVYEIKHYMQLVKPCIVFCESDRFDDVVIATTTNNNTSDVRVVKADNDKLLQNFAGSHWDNNDTFVISQARRDSIVLMIPTSGSSGLPKATMLTHGGLIAQLPTLWSHHEQFPEPTKTVLLLSSAQWVTHTLLMITCPIYGICLIMTPSKATERHISEVIDKFQPTWALLGPTFIKSLVEFCTSYQLKSLETVITTGAPLTEKIVTVLKEKLSTTAHLGNGMGMTEMHGFITVPAPGTAWQSNGKILNIFKYKIIGEDGTELCENQHGELYIKSDICLFKGYYKNENAYCESVTPDGWYKTGDIFYRDENYDIYFVERKKFWFKYLNFQIAPEELEKVICSIPDVKECVVGDSAKGPAAAVVLQTQHSLQIKNIIHRIINSTFSDYKQLRGGVYFVTSLPRTYSGKIKRTECAKLIQSLADVSECLP